MSDVRSDAPSTPDTPPALFGFQILGELSRDRLGVVYHARMVLYRREVALRLVSDEAHAGMRDLTPVCRNAEEISRHPHPQLLKIYESGESGGQMYLATELPPGPTLRDRLANGPLDVAAAVSLIGSIAAAVGHLHKQHLTHFDLTSYAIYPSSDAPPAVGELGFAGLLHARPNVHFPGDPAYAAPEQIAGHRADARADVYSLGVLLVECLTGKRPQDHPVMKDVPPALAHICKKATDPTPSHRYPDAGVLADDLARFTHGDAPAPGVIGNAIDWVRSNPAVAGLSAALAVVMVVSAVVATMLASSAAAARSEAEMARKDAEKAMTAANQVTVADAPKPDEKLKQALQTAEQNVTLAQREAKREREAKQAEIRERQNAEKRLDDEIKRRGVADEKARLADSDRKDAAAAATAGELSRAHAAFAEAMIEAGDLSGALLPITRALAIAKRQKNSEDAYRLRVATLLARLPRQLSVVRFPKGDVSSVAFIPDGSRVLIAGADGVAYLVSATSGEMVGKKVVHGAPINKAVFSPDGKRVLTGDAKGKIRVWKEDGEMVFDPIDLETPATHLGFSGDGKRFWLLRPTMGEDPGIEAQVRDAEKGDAYSGSVNVTGATATAALSFDGTRLLLGTGRTAHLHDVSSGKTVGPAFEHGAPLSGVALSGDGKFVVTSGDGWARVWSVATGKEVMPKLDQAPTLDAHFDEGGRLVLSVAEDGSARAFDVVTGKQAGPAVRASGTPRQALMSPDGRSYLLNYADGMARLIDVKSGRPALPPLAHSAPVAHAALSGDGTRLMTFDGRVVSVWDVTGGEPMSLAGPPAETGVVYSSDGKRSLRIDHESVNVETVTGEKVKFTLKHKGDVKRATFSPAGDLIVTVSDPPPGATTPTWDVRVWDAATGKALFDTIEHLREVFRADFLLGGTRLVTLSLDKQARLFDAKSGKMFGKPVEHKEDLTLADVSPDGKRLVTCDKGGQVRAWDVETGDAVGTNMPHAGTVRALVFSPDSRRLATCCENGTAFVWSLAKGEQLTKLEMSDSVAHAAFDSEGSALLTACDDGTARLWSVETGKPLTAPLRHDGPVRRVGFSEDGRWILTASGRHVRLWDSKTGEAIGLPLPHSRDDVIVTAMSLSKTGELVTQAGPGTRWARMLTPDKRDVKELFDLAAVLSGREEVGPGQLAPAAPETLTAAWRRALAAHGDDFVPPNSRLLAWARRGVKECEARGLSGGAARHLSVLLEGSSDPELFARRAKAYAEIGRHEAAVADYDKALEKIKDRWQLWAGRGSSALVLGKWDVAAADLTEATKRQDRDAVLWRQLGQAEAERGKWKEAALALNRAMRFETPPEAWLAQAVALLSAGDEKGYKQACARLAKKISGREDAAVRRAVIDACVLGETALTDYKRLLEAADAAAKDAPDDAAEQARHAALLLRAGQAAAAVKILEKIAEGSKARPGDLWLLALAYQKAGDKDKAKQAQEKAGEAKAADGTPWTERQATALFRKEAGG